VRPFPALPIATVVGALTSAMLFSRFGLRPWESLPVGFGVMVALYAILRALHRR
jgi:hypothetical protein